MSGPGPGAAGSGLHPPGGDEAIEWAPTVDRYDARHGASPVRHHQLLATAHPTEELAQVVPQGADADFRGCPRRATPTSDDRHFGEAVARRVTTTAGPLGAMLAR